MDYSLRLLLSKQGGGGAEAWMDVVRGFFGMLSDFLQFTCGTRGIVLYTSRGPAPFALTNVGKIAVFAFNSVNDACYFFFRWPVLRFLKTEASERMCLKAVFMLNCCSVSFTLSDTPFTKATTANPTGSGWRFCGLDLGWAAFSMNLVGYPLACRLSWT